MHQNEVGTVVAGSAVQSRQDLGPVLPGWTWCLHCLRSRASVILSGIQLVRLE